MTNSGDCEAFANNPWVIYNHQDSQHAVIMSEKIINGKIELTQATPIISDVNECSLHPAISVKQPKAFFMTHLLILRNHILLKMT